MKFNSAFDEIIEIDIQVGNVPMLLGEPGIGKSSFLINLAARLGTKAFILPCNQLADRTDLTGARLVPYEVNGETKYKQVFYPHQVVQEAIDYALAHPDETPLLVGDEVNRSPSDVTSAMLSLPTLRSLGSVALPDNLRIVFAGNDKGNVVALDDASVSRFSVYRVEPEAETLVTLLGDDLHPYVRKILTLHPNTIFAKSRPLSVVADGEDEDEAMTSADDLLNMGDDMLQMTTPRTISAMSDWLKAVSPAKLGEYLQTQTITDGRESTVLSEIIDGKVGNTPFADLLLNEIASSLNSGTSAQLQQLTVPKPSCFNSLKAATSITDLESEIASLSVEDRGAALVYALFEQRDNASIISQIASQLDGFTSEQNRFLVRLASESMLNEANVAVLFGTTTQIGNNAELVLGQFMS